MKKISKRFQLLKALISSKIYTMDKGIKLLKLISNAKFIESVEAHISLNINPKYTNQQIRSTLVLPHGNGKILRIAIFLDSINSINIFKKDILILNYSKLVEKISNNSIDFDVLLTTPEFMPQLTKLGKILSTKHLMPSIKSNTLTTDLNKSIEELEKGKIEYRSDKLGNIHINFGKIDFLDNKLKENLLTIYNSIEKNKPIGLKGKYFKSFNICSTMSPNIKLDLNEFKKLF